MKTKIKKLFSNKVVGYLSTRYLTYFLQFVCSILVAVKLGPFLFGIWGFLLLLLNYFRIIDFGIANATNILLVQNRGLDESNNSISSNAIYLVSLLNIVVILFSIYYYVFGIPLFDKYSADKFIGPVVLVAIVTNYNTLFMNIYRVQNSLKEISFQQSSIPFLMFIIALFFEGENLLNYLIYANVGGSIMAFLLFLKNGKIPRLVKLDISLCRGILNKGFFLFIYNISFYLIILSIKTMISINYAVEEFGVFSFAYTLGNSVLLFLQALTFIVFPKIIDKLRGEEYHSIRKTLNSIREGYVSMAFCLVLLALVFIPFFLEFIPKYRDSFSVLSLVMLTIVLYTNSFGYGTFLMAQNHERLNAFISFSSLLVNLIVASFLVFVVKVEFQYVIIATIIAYTLYAYLCVKIGKRKMGLREGFFKDFNDCFPLRLMLPFLNAVIFSLMDVKFLMIVPFVLFILLNRESLKDIGKKIKMLINKPSVVDL